AFSSTYAGVKSKIVMPVTAPLIKVMATKGYGAEVILKGDYYDQSYEHARELEKNQGLTFVHPFEDPEVIAGQGTLGLELFEEIKDLDSILVSVGGGGLISGIATVVKTINPKCKIYGIQTAAMPGMATWYKEKATTAVVKATPTIADGVAVKNPSANMYNTYISRLVDDMCTVGEDEIAEAIVLLMERAKVIVEGSGVLGLAAALSGKFQLGKKSCIVLCGGNIDLNIVAKVIERGLKRHGRLSKIVVAAEDRPGALSRMTQVIAQKKANILQVYHDRSTEGLYLNETAIELALETSGFEHFQDIKAALVNEGFRLIR
ncbi:MAG: pyridoxal-phosphate dependent enzyme, partial [Bdellovibrionales bacterium]|nr:pyridoxal-phosphate dependent enzyme [Bdellovibrionales bacterium]